MFNKSFNRNKSYIFYILLVLIFILSCFAQQHLIFNRDVSWLLEASKRMLAGGNYTNDFFENNPPWILYFYLPAVIIKKYFNIHIILSFQIYVFSLISISLIISWKLLQKIFSNDDRLLAKLFLVTLAFTFLLLPSYEFGQREHLLVVLTMPYLLLMTCRLQGFGFNRWLAASIGILAGSAFLMKPYFIPAFMLVEFYYIFCQRKIASCARPETTAIFVLGVLYVVVILGRHLDYLIQIVPFALRWCNLGHYDDWLDIVNSFAAFYSITALFLYFMTYSINRYRSLTIVLLLALIGFLFSYFIQHTAWYYHQLPALSIAFLLNLFLFSLQVSSKHESDNKWLLLFITFNCLLLIQINEFLPRYFLLMRYNIPTFFLFFVLPFLVVTLLLATKYRRSINPKSWGVITALLSILFIIFIVLIRNLYFSIFNVMMIIAILLGSIGFLFPGTIWQKAICIFYTGQGFFITASILFFTVFNYHYHAEEKNERMKMVNFINEHASGNSIQVLTTEISHVFPTVTYSNAISASRFSYFWALGGIVKQSILPTNSNIHQQQLTDKNYLIDMISRDIKSKQPKIILVDTSKEQNTLSFPTSKWGAQAKRDYIDFNYLDYFLTNKNFKDVWSSYRYLTTIKGPSNKYLNIFQYHIHLTYQHTPADLEIEDNNLYLYLRDDGMLAYAFRNSLHSVERGVIDRYLNKSQISVIRYIFSNPGQQLGSDYQLAILISITKQKLISLPFILNDYQFDVYERV